MQQIANIILKFLGEPQSEVMAIAKKLFDVEDYENLGIVAMSNTVNPYCQCLDNLAQAKKFARFEGYFLQKAVQAVGEFHKQQTLAELSIGNNAALAQLNNEVSVDYILKFLGEPQSVAQQTILHAYRHGHELATCRIAAENLQDPYCQALAYLAIQPSHPMLLIGAAQLASEYVKLQTLNQIGREIAELTKENSPQLT